VRQWTISIISHLSISSESSEISTEILTQGARLTLGLRFGVILTHFYFDYTGETKHIFWGHRSSINSRGHEVLYLFEKISIVLFYILRAKTKVSYSEAGVILTTRDF
jgi:hypothetical protein